MTGSQWQYYSFSKMTGIEIIYQSDQVRKESPVHNPHPTLPPPIYNSDPVTMTKVSRRNTPFPNWLKHKNFINLTRSEW